MKLKAFLKPIYVRYISWFVNLKPSRAAMIVWS